MIKSKILQTFYSCFLILIHMFLCYLFNQNMVFIVCKTYIFLFFFNSIVLFIHFFLKNLYKLSIIIYIICSSLRLIFGIYIYYYTISIYHHLLSFCIHFMLLYFITLFIFLPFYRNNKF